jgi:hypothetical protein
VNHLERDEDFETLELLYRHFYQRNVFSLFETLFPHFITSSFQGKNTMRLSITRSHSTINSGYAPLHCINDFGGACLHGTRTARCAVRELPMLKNSHTCTWVFYRKLYQKRGVITLFFSAPGFFVPNPEIKRNYYLPLI